MICRAPERALLLAAMLLGVSAPAQSEPPPGAGGLVHLETIPHSDLAALASLSLSPDGRHLYAAAWPSHQAQAFVRQEQAPHLVHQQTFADQADLNGVTALRVSPDGRYAVATAFQSRTATLFERHPVSGKLTRLDVARGQDGGVPGLQWPVDTVFSPDSRFVYVIDARRSGISRPQVLQGPPGALTAFKIDEGRLQWVESNIGHGGCLHGPWGVAMHPSGKWLFVASADSGALVVMNREPNSGRTSVRQVLWDEQKGVEGLAGITGVTCSPDGRFVYTVSGRHHGDDAVGVFRFESGTLSLVHEFQRSRGFLRDFLGGNRIAVSPDGRHVYATATTSGTLACFERDSETGRLQYLGTRATAGEALLGGATDLAFSPDGELLFVAAGRDAAITIFSRTSASHGASRP